MRKSALIAVIACAALGVMLVSAVAQQEESPPVRRQRTEAERAAAAQRSAQNRAALERQFGVEGQPATEGQPFRGGQPAVGGQRDNPFGEAAQGRFGGSRTRRPEAQEVAAPAAPGRAVQIELLMVELSADAKEAKAAIDLGGTADEIRSRIDDLTSKGQVEVLTHIRLSTLEQNPGMFQVGETVPVVTGRQFSGGGGDRGRPFSTASVTYENVGTILTVTPRIDGDDVLVQLAAETSRIVRNPMPEGQAEGDTNVLPPSRSMSTVQSTVRVPRGKYVVAGGGTFTGENGRKELVLLVTAAY